MAFRIDGVALLGLSNCSEWLLFTYLVYMYLSLYDISALLFALDFVFYVPFSYFRLLFKMFTIVIIESFQCLSYYYTQFNPF